MNYNFFIKKFMKIKSIYNAFAERIKTSAITAYSGQAAFFLILSFFPFLMFNFALLRYTPFTADVFIDFLKVFIPKNFNSYIEAFIHEIYNNQPTTLIPTPIITCLWLGSKSFLSLISGLNSVFDIKETRNFILIRIYTIIYTVIFAAMVFATLTVLVFGNRIFFFTDKFFPKISHTILSILSIRPVIAFLILFIMFLVMYKSIPNRKCTFTSQIPGAILTSSGWIAFSYIYSFYIDNFNQYSKFYGTMTSIALLMIWIYSCMYILFFGGILNYILSPDKKDSMH